MTNLAQTLDKAERARRKGDACSAARGFAMALAEFPGNRRAKQGLRRTRAQAVADLSRRASTLLRCGALDAAEELFAEANRLAPNDAATAHALALCRLELGRLEEAATALDRVPDCPTTQDLRGRILREQGDLDGAEACHRAALVDGPGDAAPLNNLGILARARGDLEGAVAYF
ncbi:MAG: tetratricopeptide repeat protein, partial [Pseudomonadota bacterium]|nr:tetratricopeptide repeat protein [Pseudomonadota bacterium]